ncbi:sodium:alanine symporter family protein [uncultured Desulfovibrio sp.]|uniref:alanine/glycine:cation symporter family protein n=1 Tax=uncultured Desulfovibrio sp. TaxID=167968 RepID=UPI00265D2957|nr:sodium:alanine symporter family protein [uncultured Desulfovibrio sp.]
MLDFLNVVAGYVWGWPLMILLVGTGLWLTFSLRALQFSHLIHAFGLIVRKTPDKKAQGDISNFQALMVALSATVGTGNIAGVATAIYIGGPGALFWMWMTGLVGMATKYAEAVLAVKYRVQNENGTFSGGPMYYTSRGLGWKWLATLFAFFASIATFGIGSMVQSNSVADALNHSFSIAPGITGIVLMGLTAAVIIGGVRSIGRVTALLVPVMIALYVLGALAVLIMHITEIPGVLVMVVSSAFEPVAATGGFAGATVMMAIRLGVARGLFSNESGLGSAPIAAAAARTSQPVVQALISMTQTFIDTLVVCSMTGLVILVTGVWTSGKNGAPLTSYAFETGLPGELGGLIVTIGIILFAYSTILGWSYYGEKAIEYLLGSKAIVPYRWAFIISVGLGSSMKLDLVWVLSDIFNALMAFPNLIGLIMLTPVVKAETMAYLRSLRQGSSSES